MTVKEGVTPGEYTAKTFPWHWTRALGMYEQVRSILEAAAYDKDKAVAPKSMWFRKERLDAWFKERRE